MPVHPQVSTCNAETAVCHEKSGRPGCVIVPWGGQRRRRLGRRKFTRTMNDERKPVIIPLADPPGSAAGLPQGEQVVAGLVGPSSAGGAGPAWPGWRRRPDHWPSVRRSSVRPPCQACSLPSWRHSETASRVFPLSGSEAGSGRLRGSLIPESQRAGVTGGQEQSAEVGFRRRVRCRAGGGIRTPRSRFTKAVLYRCVQLASSRCQQVCNHVNCCGAAV